MARICLRSKSLRPPQGSCKVPGTSQNPAAGLGHISPCLPFGTVAPVARGQSLQGFGVGLKSQGIDTEIATLQVAIQIAREFYPLWVAAVLVGAVVAKCGDFIGRSAQKNRHGTVFQSGSLGSAGKSFCTPLGQGIAGQVVVIDGLRPRR